jgi:pimeloyl-ACP methyl ester carboxylesterase
MPTATRISRFDHEGLFFNVRDTGPLDGDIVVLLHGFPQTASSWDAVSAELHARGYRTIAPDQRGYSPGARPRGRSAYRGSKLVADTVALISSLQAGPVHLVGHDWGASVAWMTAALRPELVRTLTTVSVPHPVAFLASMLSSDQLLRSWYMFFFQLPWLPEWLMRQKSPLAERMLTGTGMSARQSEQFRIEILDGGALHGALNWYRGMFLSRNAGLLRKVPVPTTHVWSSEDQVLSRRGAELTRNYVTGPYTLRIMPGVSHWVPEQAPQELAAIIVDTMRLAA